ncbi:hypothetical protein SAMN05216327_102304 [Dyadobacter sp. SG02]|uniref:hypothetical protein n=1 Tax=Dyadobacter sp. SG02 TaxID=1855291 RepID=UPI0008C6D485|nr:hypothetical protein [Dyadobacter sp. SG02]SEI53624.1 hypothetical protein SAMN05216327_102304 [Dyadobacter sp. SG02]
MKKSVQVLLFGLTMLLVACDIKKEATPGPGDTIPQAAISAVREAFPNATSLKFTPIEANRVWQAKFAVDAARMAVYVNSAGRIYEASQDTGTSDLPAILLQYIRKLYPKATIIEATKTIQDGTFTGYKVVIVVDPAVPSDTKTLLFDTDGNPTMDVDPGTSNGTGSQDAVSYVLGLADLPEAAKSALAGYTFEKGFAKTYDGNTIYNVLATKGGVTTTFIFDGSGNILKSYEETPVPNPNDGLVLTADNLPESIKAYLNENYAGWTFAKGAIDQLNGQIQSYLVVFMLNGSYYIGEFDAGGKPSKTIQKL